MTQDKFMQVRAALTASSNNDWSGGTTVGGAEINKRVDQLIADDINRGVDFFPLVKKRENDQLAIIWNLRTDLGSTSKSTFYTTGTGTPYPSTKVQLYSNALSLRSDYAVQGIMVKASASYYNALQDEARDALSDHMLGLERTCIVGNDSNTSYEVAGTPFVGLLQQMSSYTIGNDVTDAYGIARASGKTYLDVSSVNASAAPLTLADLDASITAADKAGASGNRMFFCSLDRRDEIDQLLQPQGRFTLGDTIELEGGKRVSSYKGYGIVGSRFMDENGRDTTSTRTYTDTAMYLLDMNDIEFVTLGGVMATHVPISGGVVSTDFTARADEIGGYFKTYGSFVMKQFSHQVLIYNLTDI